MAAKLKVKAGYEVKLPLNYSLGRAHDIFISSKLPNIM